MSLTSTNNSQSESQESTGVFKVIIAMVIVNIAIIAPFVPTIIKRIFS